MARTKRTRKEVVIAEIEKCAAEIEKYKAKVQESLETKKMLETELADIIENEKKMEQEVKMREILALMEERNVSFDDLKDILENNKSTE